MCKVEMILKICSPKWFILATSQVFDHTFSMKYVTTLLLQRNMMLKPIEVLKESSQWLAAILNYSTEITIVYQGFF